MSLIVLFDGDKQLDVAAGVRWEQSPKGHLLVWDEGTQVIAEFRDWIGVMHVEDEDEDSDEDA